MDKALKEKWVAALRSGEYEQCQEVLHDGNGYCCLGVLYRVITGENPKRYWEKTILPGEDDTSLKPRAAAEFDAATEGALVSMNDGGESFTSIANWIEENL